jgi:hypothetical protein
VGLLSLSSTVVSSSPSFRLKFVVEDFNLLLSNKLLNNPNLEQTPLKRFESPHLPGNSANKNSLDYDTFIDAHSFAQIANVDNLENIVSFQDSSGVALALQFSLNQCCLYGCVDSLDALTATLVQLFNDFKSVNNLEEELDGEDEEDEKDFNAMGMGMSDSRSRREEDNSKKQKVKGGGGPVSRHHNVSLSPSWLDQLEIDSPFNAPLFQSSNATATSVTDISADRVQQQPHQQVRGEGEERHEKVAHNLLHHRRSRWRRCATHTIRARKALRP